MALDHHHPVQNSEVYLLHSAHAPAIPPPSPPSPPSPVTPCERELPSSFDITPLDLSESSLPTQCVSDVIHVLETGATAILHTARLYETDPVFQNGVNAAVEAIISHGKEEGKLVITGVGKSGVIGRKVVATMNSLGIEATFLHPTEALHGDLGQVNPNDTILMITWSGKTSELLGLLPHFGPSNRIIVMTSHTHPSTCEIIRRRPNAILLPAPIHKSETESFGLSAPTTSTTMAVTLGDGLAFAVANRIHSNIAAVFGKNHPGGAIGQTYAGPQKISDMAIEFTGIPDVGQSSTKGTNIILSAYQSESGWVRCGENLVSSPCRIKRLQQYDMDRSASELDGLMVKISEWIVIPGDTELSLAKQWVADMRRNVPGGAIKYADDAIVVIMEDGEVSGVLEVGSLMMQS